MRRDLKEYFNTMQLQYNEVCKISEKVNEEIKEGKVTPEQKENFESYFNVVKTNYDRVFYIIHLLNLPPKFIQKYRLWKLKKDHSSKTEFSDNSTLEAVKEENCKAIDSANKELNEIVEK